MRQQFNNYDRGNPEAAREYRSETTRRQAPPLPDSPWWQDRPARVIAKDPGPLPSMAWQDPQPIKSQLPGVKAFDPELLPDRLRDYVFDISDRQQSPPDFAAVAALTGLASIVGNEVTINPKTHDDWSVTPNLWGAIIGRPSAMKSPAMRAALAPVFSLQEILRRDWETANKDREIDAAVNAIAAKDNAKEAAKALKEGNRERARALVAQGVDDNEETACPRLIVNDASVEKLGELLNENRHGLLLVRDELAGFLSRMNAEEFQSERAFYLESFNGDGSFTYDRIGRGTVHIERATLSIIGAVQPARIAPLVRGAMSGEADDGLLQRFQLAVWPDDPKEWRWIDRSPNARARMGFDAVFQELHIFARNLAAPVALRFDDKAQGMFRDWMTEVQAVARSGKMPGAMESHFLKLPKAVAALALLFEMVDGGRDHVGAVATGRALDWADYLASHACRLYSAGVVAAENAARLIIDRRDQLPEKFTGRDIQRKGWAGLQDRDTVAAALDLMADASIIRGRVNPAGEAGGRPATIYEWSPKLTIGGDHGQVA